MAQVELADRKVADTNKRHFDALFSDPTQAYRLHAKGLLTYSPREGRWLARRIRRLTGLRLPVGARVLELGGGSGYASINLAHGAHHGAHVTFLDIAFSAVALSLQQSAQERISGCGLQANATALPFAEASFDAVIGRSFVHHIPDLSALLVESWRVTKPGGWILFLTEPAVPGAERYRAFKRLYARLIHRGRLPEGSEEFEETKRYVRSAEELRRLMRQLQLEGDVVETGIAGPYLGFLCYPFLLKLKSARLSAFVHRALKPLAWLDDALLRRLLPRWTCEQWIVLRRMA